MSILDKHARPLQDFLGQKSPKTMMITQVDAEDELKKETDYTVLLISEKKKLQEKNKFLKEIVGKSDLAEYCSELQEQNAELDAKHKALEKECSLIIKNLKDQDKELRERLIKSGYHDDDCSTHQSTYLACTCFINTITKQQD